MALRSVGRLVCLYRVGQCCYFSEPIAAAARRTLCTSYNAKHHLLPAPLGRWLAPPLMSALTTSACPFAHDRWSAVLPWASWWLASTPRERMTSTSSTSPYLAGPKPGEYHEYVSGCRLFLWRSISQITEQSSSMRQCFLDRSVLLSRGFNTQ